MLVMSEKTWTKRSEEAVRCDLSRIGRILILKCGLWGKHNEEKIYQAVCNTAGSLSGITGGGMAFF